MMLTPSYDAVRQFQRKISEIKNTEELKVALKQSNLRISARLESSIPWRVYWDILEDSMVGNCNIAVYPRVYAGGEIYEATHSERINAFKGYSGMSDFEVQILEALKRSVPTVQRVWD
jgi:hypothetical protein